jgi:hypothetical protein
MKERICCGFDDDVIAGMFYDSYSNWW